MKALWDALQSVTALQGETALAPAICVFISSNERGEKQVASFSRGLGRSDEEDRDAFIEMLEMVAADLRAKRDGL